VYFCRYGKKHPHFYVGSLENAMEEVISNMEDPDQVSMIITLYYFVI
jgi:hypothetical protein